MDTPTPPSDHDDPGAPGPLDALDRDRNAEGRPENARPRDRFGAPLPRGSVDAMAERVEPADVCTTVQEAVTTALALVDQQRFFEAHEFFEWAWKGPVTPAQDRPFFKGMAQLAVGYCHTQRGNATGALTLLRRGIDGIARFGPAHHGIDVAGTVQGAESFRAGVGDGRIGPDLDFPAVPQVDPSG